MPFDARPGSNVSWIKTGAIVVRRQHPMQIRYTASAPNRLRLSASFD
jgi:hypothetical protein